MALSLFSLPRFPQAECRSMPPHWWDHDAEPELHVLAVEICERCPHQTECLLWAVENRESGIWGGRRVNTGRVTRVAPADETS